jgi:hypothetical protein
MFKLDEKLLEELWLNEKSIAYFVCDSVSYWVIDYKYHYQLDEEVEAKALLDKGYITLETFYSGLKNSRGGISKLKKENFAKYLELGETIVLSTANLKQIIFHGFSQERLGELYSSIEYYLSSGYELEGDLLDAINQIKSRLPRYYINFDRQIYLHTDYDYSPESSVSYEEWVASVGDFSYYIPDSKNYWILNEKNFWKAMHL